MSTLKSSVEIAAPPNEVWRVLTTRDLVREWAAEFIDEIDVVSSWRPGARIVWKARDVGFARQGVIAEMESLQRLKFDYPNDPAGPFSETYEIVPAACGTRVTLTVDPLAPAERKRLEPLVGAALQHIKGLAEESASIFGLGRRDQPRP